MITNMLLHLCHYSSFPPRYYILLMYLSTIIIFNFVFNFHINILNLCYNVVCYVLYSVIQLSYYIVKFMFYVRFCVSKYNSLLSFLIGVSAADFADILPFCAPIHLIFLVKLCSCYVICLFCN